MRSLGRAIIMSIIHMMTGMTGGCIRLNAGLGAGFGRMIISGMNIHTRHRPLADIQHGQQKDDDDMED